MTMSGRASSQPERLEGRRLRGRLRQLAWASVPVWSLTLLAFVPFLRLAIARRRARDWAVFAGYVAAVVLEIVFLSSGGPNGDGPVFTIGIVLSLILMGAAPVHAFVAFRPAPNLPDANLHAVAGARARMQRRSEARELARSNPDLARELRIGRPDLPREYDDGGMIDVNHVPGEVLASGLGLAPQETAAVVETREQLGRFISPEELAAYAQLPPDRVDALRDWMLFG
jgi:hypothetical protein